MRQPRRVAHALVVPRRLRIPLVGEVEPEGALDHHRLQRQARRLLQLLGELAADRVGDVDLAALQRRQPRRLLGHHLEDQPLHGGHLAPVALEGFEHQLHAGREGDELVRPGADRRLLEPVLADLLDVFLRHDPARAGGGAVERQEIRPRLLQHEADAALIRRLDRRHPLLHQRRRGAAIALEGELHVLRGHRLAVVELRAGAHGEFVAEPVRRHLHRCRQGTARRRCRASASPSRRAARTSAGRA